mmetsp:Transcript_47267/g.109376  ORF Transcript_47267/g.109376 Transcript_47267/m.109376 type:complete len:204 (-) Transcript_47267:1022-1633(-)
MKVKEAKAAVMAIAVGVAGERSGLERSFAARARAKVRTAVGNAMPRGVQRMAKGVQRTSPSQAGDGTLRASGPTHAGSTASAATSETTGSVAHLAGRAGRATFAAWQPALCVVRGVQPRFWLPALATEAATSPALQPSVSSTGVDRERTVGTSSSSPEHHEFAAIVTALWTPGAVASRTHRSRCACARLRGVASRSTFGASSC